MDALDTARRALDIVQDDPAASASTARQLLDDPALPGRAAVVAGWALGRSAHELDDNAAAVRHLSAALTRATEDAPDLAGEIRVSLSLCLFQTGQIAEAFIQLDLADADLDGARLGRAMMQRALLEHLRGEQRRALELFDRAQPLLAADADDVAEARLLTNRSALLTYLGEWERAESDLHHLEELATQLGQRLMLGAARHNLGFLHGRRGAISEALRLFDRARRDYQHAGGAARLLASLDLDEGELQLTAGLFEEAAASAKQAVEHSRASANRTAEADSLLLLARAELAVGNRVAAQDAAETAVRRLVADGREPLAPLASACAFEAELGSRLGDASATDADVRRARSLALDLRRHGWRAEALRVVSLVAGACIRSGDLDRARDVLRGERRSGSSRRDDPAITQLAARHVEALARIVDGSTGSGARAIVAGLRALERHRATLAATELRVAASEHGRELAALGLDLGIGGSGRRGVLLWAERFRAAASLADVTVPDVADDAFADLRDAYATLGQVLGSAGDARTARRELRAAERRVAAAVRRSAGSALETNLLTRERLDQLVDAASGVTVLEFVRHRSVLWAVTIRHGSVRARELTDLATVDGLVARLGFAIRRVTQAGDDPPAVHAAEMLVAATVAQLEELLLASTVAPEPGEPLVIVPTGALHDVAWGLLPMLEDRPFEVAPSLRWWVEHPAHAPAPATVTALCGPGLEFAQAECADVVDAHGGGAIRGPAGLGPVEVAADMATHDIVHVAAHGAFREDNPMFSQLLFDHAPLTLYELATLPHVPHTVVLSACDTGRVQRRRDDELVGMAATLLTLGVGVAVSPIVPVPDAKTAAPMRRLHQELAAGAGAAAAMATVRAEFRRRPSVEWVTAACFAVFGRSLA